MAHDPSRSIRNTLTQSIALKKSLNEDVFIKPEKEQKSAICAKILSPYRKPNRKFITKKIEKTILPFIIFH